MESANTLGVLNMYGRAAETVIKRLSDSEPSVRAHAVTSLVRFHLIMELSPFYHWEDNSCINSSLLLTPSCLLVWHCQFNVNIFLVVELWKKWSNTNINLKLQGAEFKFCIQRLLIHGTNCLQCNDIARLKFSFTFFIFCRVPLASSNPKCWEFSQKC